MTEQIKAVRADFKKTIAEVQKTDNTAVNKALLSLALRQNDLIYTYEKQESGRYKP